ncbi:MAG: hypothetical protein ACXWVS_02015 [Hyphomicrobium sp.]
MAHMVGHVAQNRHENLVALSIEWIRLDDRAQDLRKQRSATVTVDWILRRQAAIRDMMIETSAATMADVGAKHRVATAQGNDALDEDLLESAESDVVRLVYA